MGPNAPSRLLPQMSLCPCLCPSDSHCWHDCLASTNDNHDFHGQATKTGDGPCTLVSWVGGGGFRHTGIFQQKHGNQNQKPLQNTTFAHFCRIFLKKIRRAQVFLSGPAAPSAPSAARLGNKLLAGWTLLGSPLA